MFLELPQRSFTTMTQFQRKINEMHANQQYVYMSETKYTEKSILQMVKCSISRRSLHISVIRSKVRCTVPYLAEPIPTAPQILPYTTSQLTSIICSPSFSHNAAFTLPPSDTLYTQSLLPLHAISPPSIPSPPSHHPTHPRNHIHNTLRTNMSPRHMSLRPNSHP